jgi:iron complex outermembrane receptor protein
MTIGELSMTRGSWLAGASAACLALASAGAATAQQASQPPTSVQEVVVTGSRVVRDGYSAPTPVTAVTSDQLLSAQPRSIPEAVLQLPQVINSGTRNACCSAGQGSNAASGTFINLRGLGANRTLVLLDGQRMNPTTEVGTVDSELIPELLIQRVDVVTGGASAAYGSDAVSGVVNYVVDNKYSGLKGIIQGGISKYSDDRSRKFAFAYGRSFANGRGHIVVSAKYFKEDGIASVLDRPTGAQNWLLGGNGSAAFPWKEVSDVGYMTATFGGLIVNENNLGVATARNPLAGLQFQPGGVVAPFNTGTPIPGSPTFCSHCDGANASISMPAGRGRSTHFYTRAQYDLTDDITAFVRINAGESRNYQRYQNDERQNAQAFTIFADNAFLPQALRNQMGTLGLPSFRLARNSTYDIPIIERDNLTTAYDVYGGLEGKWRQFDWTLGASHGFTRLRGADTNDVAVGNIYAAADAVRDPSGTVVCRVTLTNPGVFPGCVPINLFGVGAPSQAAIDYVTDRDNHEVQNSQTLFSFDAHGDIFKLPAGTVSLAVGAEYRRRSLVELSNPIATGKINSTGVRGFPTSICPTPATCREGGYNFGNNGTADAHDAVEEAYAEVLVPILRDMRFARSLDFNGAYRYTHYTASGGVPTWKLGVTYSPFDDLRFRATRSRDIRAPNLYELYSAPIYGFSPALIDPLTHVPGFVVTSTQGNPNLKPEVGDTKAFGVVYSPSWLPGFSGSIDYYAISIAGGITTYGGQTAADDCNRGDQTACALIIRDPATNSIQLAVTQRVNLTAQRQRGVDFDFSYRVPLEALSVPGSLTARALFTHIITNESVGGNGVVTNNAGQVSQGGPTGAPDWKGTVSLAYDDGPFGAFVQFRYLDNLYLTPPVVGTIFSGNDGKLPTMIYTDVNLRYRLERFGGNQELFFGVQNLFNKGPPVAPSRIAPVGFPTAAGAGYDIVGRYFDVGLRFNF